MKIKILGTGCMKCRKLEQETANALVELGLAADIEKVTELDKILQYDVMMTPGLVINEKVKVFGRVPRGAEIKRWIQEEL
ncbi:MAG TPA: thioredoxin family protein [Firmicutes bacterium]|jgi:small redox-active disulfide protein 2|nr:thioredoxin family protein [Bacillota bacterium]